MKIYIVTDKIFPLDSDGGTAFTSFEWAQYLTDLGYEVVVLYHGNKAVTDHRFGFSCETVSGLLQLARILRRGGREDIVFLNSAFKLWEAYYLCLSYLFPKTLFWLAHGSLDTRLTGALKKKLYVRFWAGALAARCRSYICNSAGEYEFLPEKIKRKALVIENLMPIHTLGVEKAALSQPEAQDSSDPYFLIFGRIDKKKRIVETIDALEKIGFFKQYRLVVAGVSHDEAYRDLVARKIEALSLQDQCALIPKHISGAEKIALLRSSEGLLLFSDSEGLPIVILEAVSLGKKVLCSPGCNVSHMDQIIVVKELQELGLADFETPSPDPQALASFDIGRNKLRQLCADLTS